MRLSRIRVTVVIAVIGLCAASCGGDSTSPSSSALDGAWTTGTACLTLGLGLNWTSHTVSGTGTYRTDLGPASCTPPASLDETGQVALDATRPDAKTIIGTMAFDGSIIASFTGTLVDSVSPALIDGSVHTPDGATTPVTLYNALIP